MKKVYYFDVKRVGDVISIEGKLPPPFENLGLGKNKIVLDGKTIRVFVKIVTNFSKGVTYPAYQIKVTELKRR